MRTSLRSLLVLALAVAGCAQTYESKPRVAQAIDRARSVAPERIDRAGGEEPPPLKSSYSLGELIRLGLDRNESLIQSSLDVGVAAATSAATHAQMFAPTLTATASDRRSANPPSFSTNSGSITGSGRSARWGLAIRWAPFHVGNALYRYESVRLGEDRARLEMRRAEQQIVFLVVQLYFQRLALEGRLEVTNGFIRSLESEESRVRRLVEAESAIENDVMKIGLELTRQRQTRVETENEIAVVIRRLNQALMLPHDATYELEWNRPFAERDLPEASALIETALENRPDLRAQEVAIEALRLERNAERADALPSVAVEIGFEQSETDFSDSEEGFAQIAATWDLFELGRNHRAARLQRQALSALSRLRESQRSVAIEVEEALREIANQASAYRLGQFAVRQATENLRVQRAQYNAERSTANDLLEAEVELTDARNTVVQATYAYQVALAQLEAALGAIGRFDVGEPTLMETPVDADDDDDE